MKPVVHYPREGITYMRGQCGANSIRSTTDLAQVTCVKCLELINKTLLQSAGALPPPDRLPGQ